MSRPKLVRRAFLNKNRTMPAVSVVDANGRNATWTITDCRRSIELDFGLRGDDFERSRRAALHKLDVLEGHLNALRRYLEEVQHEDIDGASQ